MPLERLRPHRSGCPMPPPPAKKVKAASADTTEPVLGSIIDWESPSKSDRDNRHPCGSSDDEDKSDGTSSSESKDLDDVIVHSAPPSPPLTVSKRKRGRKSKAAQEEGAIGA